MWFIIIIIIIIVIIFLNEKLTIATHYITHSTAAGPLHCQDARPGNRCHRLNYCNSLMYGMSNRKFKQLQVTQNALARAVCSDPWSTS